MDTNLEEFSSNERFDRILRHKATFSTPKIIALVCVVILSEENDESTKT